VSVTDGYCHERIKGSAGLEKVKVMGLAVKTVSPIVALADAVIVSVQSV
jgi:hypothetical protein